MKKQFLFVLGACAACPTFAMNEVMSNSPVSSAIPAVSPAPVVDPEIFETIGARFSIASPKTWRRWENAFDAYWRAVGSDHKDYALAYKIKSELMNSFKALGAMRTAYDNALKSDADMTEVENAIIDALPHMNNWMELRWELPQDLEGKDTREFRKASDELTNVERGIMDEIDDFRSWAKRYDRQHGTNHSDQFIFMTESLKSAIGKLKKGSHSNLSEEAKKQQKKILNLFERFVLAFRLMDDTEWEGANIRQISNYRKFQSNLVDVYITGYTFKQLIDKVSSVEAVEYFISHDVVDLLPLVKSLVDDAGKIQIPEKEQENWNNLIFILHQLKDELHDVIKQYDEKHKTKHAEFFS